jgi:hypothetical protein
MFEHKKEGRFTMAIISETHGKLLSSKEVAEILTKRSNGIRTYTNIGVNRMVYAGRLKPVETVGGANFFLPKDVEQLKIYPKKGNPATREKRGIAGTGVNRLEIANRAGVSQTTVWNAFSGKPISQETADKLFTAFNLLREEKQLPAMTIDQLGWNIVDK